MLYIQKNAKLLHIIAEGFKAAVFAATHLRMMDARCMTHLRQAQVRLQAGFFNSNADVCGFGCGELVAHCANYVQNIRKSRGTL